MLKEPVRRRHILDHRPTGTVPAQIHLSDFGLSHSTRRNFICTLLNPDLAHSPIAKQALMHMWLTSFTAATEHDLSGLHKNFDPHTCWCSAIMARALLHLMHYKSTITMTG